MIHIFRTYIRRNFIGSKVNFNLLLYENVNAQYCRHIHDETDEALVKDGFASAGGKQQKLALEAK